MNRTNLTEYRIPFGSPEWFRFRQTGLTVEDAIKLNCPQYAGGIGSSEIANILGLMPDWDPCPQQVYHFKIGTETPSTIANKNMVMGKAMEPLIGIIWKVFEGDKYSWSPKFNEYLDADAKVKDYLSVRKSKKINSYFVNNRYPHLFSSFDYFAEKGTVGLLKREDGTYETFDEGFPIECKRIKRMYANTWEYGIPPSFVTQLHQEMICSNSHYGEIAVLYDDNEFEIFPFYRNNETCAAVIHWGEVFWNTVLSGRESKMKMDKFYQLGQMESGDEQMSIITSNEPDPDNGEAYMRYKKLKYQPGYVEETQGDIPLYYDALEYKLAGALNNMLKEKQQGLKNKFMEILVRTGAQRISFGDIGKITYEADKNGDRSLLVKPKTLNSLKDRSEKEFSKLNFENI